MKKGDIIKPKEGESFTDHEAKTLGFNSASEIPELLEVSGVKTILECCTVITMLTIVGFPQHLAIREDIFELVLPASEPDVKQLMEEVAKQSEVHKMMATMY